MDPANAGATTRSAEAAAQEGSAVGSHGARKVRKTVRAVKATREFFVAFGARLSKGPVRMSGGRRGKAHAPSQRTVTRWSMFRLSWFVWFGVTWESAESNDVQDDHAAIGVIVVLSWCWACWPSRSGIPFNRQFQTWAALLTLAAIPLFTLPYLLDNERR